MATSSSDKGNSETMKDDKSSLNMEGRVGSVAATTGDRAAQNGEQAAMDVQNLGDRGFRSRNNSSEQVKYENSAGTAVRQMDEPPRKRFQIPRKNRDKKVLQTVCSGSREFDEILKILHSSYLDSNSVTHFTYKSARLVHNEFMEKEFIEKRRQLKFDGRPDKELVESYAFLLVDNDQVNTISERGLIVGHSKLTTLGKSSMGIYLSRFSDLLQANPLDPGTTGNIFIFKVIKGKIKGIYDQMRHNQMDSSFGALDPAPKHECHVFKNINNVTTLLSYRAFERSQYYFYEYGFDEILKRPRHVCPFAAVLFGYKEEMTPRQPSLFLSGSPVINTDKYADRSCFTLWRGQLLNKGKLLCYASLKSINGPFLPYKLPDRLNLNTVMQIDQLKKKIPSVLFFKETHNKSKEVTMGGMFSRMYEVVEKTRTGNNFQNLLLKLEKEKLALVKPLADKGFLFLFFPSPMTTSYGSQSGRSRLLHALFVYKESREALPHVNWKAATVMQDNPEIMPELTTFISSLHVGLHKSHADTSADFNIVVEKHASVYLKRRAERSSKYKEYVPKPYDTRLDYKKSLYTAPKDKSRVAIPLKNYIFGSEAYTLPVDRAKELIKANQQFQQFSPVSDYEPIEEEEVTKPVNNKRLSHATEVVNEQATSRADYDLDKLNGLINLIQSRKHNSFTSSEPEETLSSGIKRKIESSPENQWKHLKREETAYSQEQPAETSHSMTSFISALGGQDTDLRQENADQSIAETADFIKLLLATLADSNANVSPEESMNKVADSTNEDIGQNNEMAMDIVSDSPDQEENAGHGSEKSVQESSATILSHPAEVDLQTEETCHYPENIEPRTPPYSKSASPCPSTPTETVYQRQCSSSDNVDGEMLWKLIPITGEGRRFPVDHVGNIRDAKTQGLNLSEEQLSFLSPKDAHPDDPRVLHNRRRRSSGCSPYQDYKRKKNRTFKHEKEDRKDHLSAHSREHNLFETKHCENGVIENTVLEVYGIFSERLYEVLRQKEITYMGNSVTPLLSSNQRVARLSDWLYTQTSDISINRYVEDLHDRLESIVTASVNSSGVDRPVNDTFPENEDNDERLLSMREMTSVPSYTEINETHAQGNIPSNRNLQECEGQSSLADYPHVEESRNNRESSPLRSTFSSSPRTPEKNTSSLPEFNSATQTALTDLINQMHPEVFNNLMKIFTHVNKNIVKFYIHSEEENVTCGEIKEYLQKLGNAECHPQTFLESRELADKLLIIIQNEDIAHCIHRIPALVALKKLPCVSFAGVDSLEDLKNHTYNELFVSGGFIVSDETLLNPDSITFDTLKSFLSFLEEIDSAEGKWQWKIHCKFQKKLKELARLNSNALNMLTLLNTYQKKHLVEILSYHNCDSQTRQAPELECLIKLQVQNIHQRHVLFLTEKNVSLFPNHYDNGIVVTTMQEFMLKFSSIVGHHNSNTEDNCLSQLASQEDKTVPTESNVKEEDDMSIDSEDEAPHIEVCTDSLKHVSQIEESTKGSDCVETSFTKSYVDFAQSKAPSVGTNEVQSVTPISTTCQNNTVPENISRDLQDSKSKQNLSHQFSHFNVLTHQTFLGAMHPILANQPQGGNYFINPPEPDPSQNPEWDKKWNLK